MQIRLMLVLVLFIYLAPLAHSLTASHCQSDLLSTGVLLSIIGECQCTVRAYWDADTQQCLPYCYMDPFSTGVAQGTQACNCKESFVWSEQKSKCVLDCTAIGLSTGQPKGDYVCECAPPAVWNFLTRSCEGDCSKIAYSTGKGNPDGGCICKNKFVWKDADRACEVDCNQVSSLSTGVQLSQNQCGCKTGAFWSFDEIDCMRNCSVYEFSTGMNVDAEECVCKDGYIWQTTPSTLCKRDCGIRPGELQTFNEDLQYCDCETPAYFFSYQLQRCAINCNEKPHTIPISYPYVLKCECSLGYSWDADNGDTGNCTIDCSGPFDIGTLTTSTCSCEKNAFFDSFTSSCTVNCRIDTLSTMAFTGSSCVCKDNAIWSSSENKCICDTGFTYNSSKKECDPVGSSASAAVIGAMGGVGSTLLVAAVGKFIQKQREARKEKDTGACCSGDNGLVE